MSSRVRLATADDIERLLEEGPEGVRFGAGQGAFLLSWGEGVVLDVDGAPAAALGYVEPWPGLAEVWGVIGAEGRRRFRLVHRTAKQFLAFAIADRGWRRIELNALADPRFCRWALSLGFRVCGQRCRYGPDGENFVLYERVVA